MLSSNSRIKIFFVDHTPFIGGAQLCLAEHVRALDKSHFEPFIVTDKNSPYNAIYDQTGATILLMDLVVFNRPTMAYHVARSLRQFQRLVQQEKPSVVVANTTKALIVTSLSKGNYALISYLRDYNYRKWLVDILGRRVDKFLTVSDSIKDFYAGKGPKFETVYLGSDMYGELQNVSRERIERWKGENGIKKDDIVIGYAGRLVAWKGAQILTEAALKLHNPHVKLLLFGTGQGQEENIEDDLHQLVTKEHAQEQVIFPGFIKDRALIYALSDIFVLASYEPEPFATNVIEAAQSHLPIVATDIGGTAEFVRDHENGLLVKPKSVDEMKDALKALIQDRLLAKKLGDKAYEDGMQFTEENLARKLEKIYNQYS